MSPCDAEVSTAQLKGPKEEQVPGEQLLGRIALAISIVT